MRSASSKHHHFLHHQHLNLRSAAMSADANSLKEMGFAPDRIAWALRATKNSGLQPAMDHILANMDNAVPETSEEEAAVAAAEGGEAEAKSIKCSECGKIFKNSALAQYHAEKSGHTDFEESTEEVKPLTEEEKKAKLEELRNRLAEKRAKQSTVDAAEAKANEMIRRKAGKDMDVAREEMKKREAIKEAEAKKREKLEEAQARARIKAQIEADKRERAAKAAREKELRDSGGSIQATAATGVAASPLAALRAGSAGKGSEARLRVRGPGGVMWTGVVPADAKLRTVLEKMDQDGKLAGSPGIESVQLSNTFPRKQFADADLDKTVSELGLVPNAGLEAAW